MYMKHKNLLKGILTAGIAAVVISLAAGNNLVSAADFGSSADDGVYEVELTSDMEEELKRGINHSGGFADVHYMPETEQRLQAGENSENWKTLLGKRLAEIIESGETKGDVSDLQIMYPDAAAADYLNEYLNEHTEYFYVSYIYFSSYEAADNSSYKALTVSVVYSSEYKDGDRLNMQLINEKKAGVENAVKNALSVISQDMSDIEKALAIHDWIVRECDYDYQSETISADSYSYVGVLCNGKAVCQGYAEAMSVLLKKAGIESYVVSSYSMNHAWNVVRLDGNYYHIDATWDDPVMSDNQYEDNIDEGFVSHTYFVRSDSEMTEKYNHYGWTTTDIPICNKENSYEEYIFRDYPNRAFSYVDGRWYFYNIADDGGRIISASIDGKDVKSIKTDDYLSGLFVHKDMVYAYNVHYIYSVSVNELKNLKEGENVVLNTVYDLTEKNPGYTAQEFSIKKGCIILNASLMNENLQFRYEHIRIDLYESETTYGIEVLYPSKNTYEKGEALDTAGLVVYKSYENGIIRTIDNNKITLTGYLSDVLGKQRIQIVYEGSVIGSYDVKVVVSLKGIELNISNVQITEGKTTVLTVNYNPSDTTEDKTVVWSSDNTDVAAVDENGIVTAKKYGTATITAKVGEYTAKCYVAVMEVQHSYKALVEREATCTETGLIRYTCENCHTSYTETTSALGHKYSAWYTKAEATCSHTGTEARMCQRCYKEETLEIAKKEHTIEDIPSSAANCTQAGSVGGKRCKECGTITQQPLIIDALGHIGGEADCSHLAVCDRCSQKYGGYDTALHKHTGIINAKEADYGTAGYTGDKICKDCGKVLEYGETIPELKDETPENTSGWQVIDGVSYWYEKGVRQGYNPKDISYRGKEIYDPESDAWYWLDNVLCGAVARDKDVYQESFAGQFADREDGTGKWVRYDENGKMIKGEDYRYGGWYRFDDETGAMVKGWYTTQTGDTYYYNMGTGQMEHGFVEIDGTHYLFDYDTGILADKKWYLQDGTEYWYEGGIRQGTQGRGKEIFDEASNAWYWLDAVQNGAKTVSKDVYQESFAGQFADRKDGTGKWVRYDAEGQMIKGWHVQNGKIYYFDVQTGAMAKGAAVIDGAEYFFNLETGVCGE